tara:strand:+ start:607 stop:1602 length:996 start_codon:yes stop_codon:yes gene_type:complete
MAESTAQETLASEGLSPQTEDTSPAAPELTDDQLWDQVGKPPAEVEDVSDDATVDASSTTEAEEESEVFEVEAPSEPTAEERKEEHNYEKRYKDLEKEFHRRNEETKELREQFQQLRLERLEMERQLAKPKEETLVEAKPKEPSPLDEDWFDPATKQTLDEFQELTSAYKKLIAHEIAKATKGIQMPEIPEDRIGQLEEIAQQYKANQYRLQHAAHMRTSVGDDYMDIDKSQEFYDYVNASPIRLAAMTKSMNPEDHAAVMNDFLNTPVGREKFRSEPAPEVAAAPVAAAETQGTVRRKAAQGLLKNSNPRQQERRPEDMNDEELWESIAV